MSKLSNLNEYYISIIKLSQVYNQRHLALEPKTKVFVATSLLYRSPSSLHIENNGAPEGLR